MKTLIFSLTVTFSLFAFSASAQTTTRMTAHQFYDRCGAACDPSLSVRKAQAHAGTAKVASVAKVTPMDTTSTTAGLGDAIYAYFRSSTGEFARKGDEVKLYLDIVQAYDQPVNIYGRRAKLDNIGNWQSFDYYSAEGGDNGWFQGLHLGQSSILAYSGKVSGDQQVGDGFAFDVSIVDAQTGVLLEQAFTGYNVVANFSQAGRGYTYLNRAYVAGQGANNYVALEGAIPTWSPLFVEFIAPDQFEINAPLPTLAQSASTPPIIQQLQVTLGILNPSPTTLDVVMVVQETRQHYTLPKSVILAGTPLTAVPAQ